MRTSTKDMIIAAFYEEISKENSKNINITYLSEKVHVARSTIYYQFSSMNDVYSYFLNTHFFDQLNQQSGYCDLLQHTSHFIENNLRCCRYLRNETHTDLRRKFLYQRFYDYLFNCSSFTATLDYRKTEMFKREVRVLTKSLMFQIELWLQGDSDFRDFNNNLQYHFDNARRNLISKKHRHVLSKYIKN